MEYKYNGKRATSLGSEGIIITKENSYEATKVTGLKRALINMFKNDKEMQWLLKGLVLDKNKLANYNIDISKDNKFSGKVSMIFAALEKTTAGWEYRMIAEPTTKRTLSDLESMCSKI